MPGLTPRFIAPRKDFERRKARGSASAASSGSERICAACAFIRNDACVTCFIPVEYEERTHNLQGRMIASYLRRLKIPHSQNGRILLSHSANDHILHQAGIASSGISSQLVILYNGRVTHLAIAWTVSF